MYTMDFMTTTTGSLIAWIIRVGGYLVAEKYKRIKKECITVKLSGERDETVTKKHSEGEVVLEDMLCFFEGKSGIG